MKNLPDDPAELHRHTIKAFCNDLIDIQAGKATRCDRTNALRHIIQTRKEQRK